MGGRLILLNGPPGVGKSTLARRWVADRPLALNLDVDVVRALLGGGPAHLTDSWLRARELGLAMARVQLDHSAEVIVPQFLGRLTFIDQLAALAADTGAGFVEVALVTDRDEAVRRFRARPDGPVEPTARLHEMHANLLTMLAARPGTVVIDSEPDAVDRTFAALRRVLDDEPGPRARS